MRACNVAKDVRIRLYMQDVFIKKKDLYTLKLSKTSLHVVLMYQSLIDLKES